MDLRSYVRENQHIIMFVHQATPGVIDKYVGTLDYATARFNTILLKLSQDPLLLTIHSTRLRLFQPIQDFLQGHYNDIDSGLVYQTLSIGYNYTDRHRQHSKDKKTLNTKN